MIFARLQALFKPARPSNPPPPPAFGLVPSNTSISASLAGVVGPSVQVDNRRPAKMTRMTSITSWHPTPSSPLSYCPRVTVLTPSAISQPTSTSSTSFNRPSDNSPRMAVASSNLPLTYCPTYTVTQPSPPPRPPAFPVKMDIDDVATPPNKNKVMVDYMDTDDQSTQSGCWLRTGPSQISPVDVTMKDPPQQYKAENILSDDDAEMSYPPLSLAVEDELVALFSRLSLLDAMDIEVDCDSIPPPATIPIPNIDFDHPMPYFLEPARRPKSRRAYAYPSSATRKTCVYSAPVAILPFAVRASGTFSPASSTETLVNGPIACRTSEVRSWKNKWKELVKFGKRNKGDWVTLKDALSRDEDTGRDLKKAKPEGKPGWLERHRARLRKRRREWVFI